MYKLKNIVLKTTNAQKSLFFRCFILPQSPYFPVLKSIWCIVPKQPRSHVYEHIHHAHVGVCAHAAAAARIFHTPPAMRFDGD